jgi:hypothetical protein
LKSIEIESAMGSQYLFMRSSRSSNVENKEPNFQENIRLSRRKLEHIAHGTKESEK